MEYLPIALGSTPTSFARGFPSTGSSKKSGQFKTVRHRLWCSSFQFQKGFVDGKNVIIAPRPYIIINPMIARRVTRKTFPGSRSGKKTMMGIFFVMLPGPSRGSRL